CCQQVRHTDIRTACARPPATTGTGARPDTTPAGAFPCAGPAEGPPALQARECGSVPRLRLLRVEIRKNQLTSNLSRVSMQLLESPVNDRLLKTPEHAPAVPLRTLSQQW